jgi:hypothetical protein
MRPDGADGAVVSHKWCADFASANQGLPYDPGTLWSEFLRSRRLKCSLCGGGGAAAGCALARCSATYHLQCALAPAAGVAFCMHSNSLACGKHAAALGPQQLPPRKLPPQAPLLQD